MKWKVEAGRMRIKIGSSSADIRLEDTFVITSDAYVESKTRGFYSAASVSSPVLS